MDWHGKSALLQEALAQFGEEYQARACDFSPFLVFWSMFRGQAFGGFKSRSEVPPLIDDYENGDLELDQYITHRFQGVEGTLEAVKALHSGDCLRAVVTY